MDESEFMQWSKWAAEHDPVSWVLIASWLIESADFVNMPDADLPVYFELLQRRDAVLAELPMSPTPGEVVH